MNRSLAIFHSIVCFLLVLAAAQAQAHGEEAPGPHGGHVRMPGAFHTELMLDEKREAHIYLLDIAFKNPTVKDSQIEMKFVSGKKETPFKCAIMGGDHFHCVPQTKYSDKGELRIKATREKAVGQEVVYKLPLAPFKAAVSKDFHHGH